MIRIRWKILLISFVSFFALGGIAAAIAIRSENPNKLSFYNYGAYASEKGQSQLESLYSYQEIETAEGFKDLLSAGRLAGGVTASYAIAQFAREGLIKEIDYSKFLGVGNKEDYDEAWIKRTYSPLVYQQMKIFDEYLNTGRDVSLPRKHLWQYMVPYFTQEKLVAYDWNDIDKSKLTQAELNAQEISFSQNDKRSLGSIFTKLREKFIAKKRIIVHDELRDNIAYGSTIDNQNKENFDGNLSLSTLDQYVQSFVNDITEQGRVPLSDAQELTITADSGDILNDLINPFKNVGASVLYNGDAIDSFFAEDNFAFYGTPRQGIDPYPIRVVRPTTQITLLDGFIISSQTTTEQANTMLQNVHNALYQGIYTEDYSQNNPSISDVYQSPGFANFDFIRYTPVTNLLLNSIFEGDPKGNPNFKIEDAIAYKDFVLSKDESGEDVFFGTLSRADILKKISLIEDVYNVKLIENPSFIMPSSDVLLAAAQIVYDRFTKN